MNSYIHDNSGRPIAIHGANRCDDCATRKSILYTATLNGQRRFYCRLCYGYHNGKPAPEVTAEILRQEFIKLLKEGR